jgi:hypothetical protein
MPLQDNLKLVVNDLIEIRLNLSMNNLNLNRNGEFNSVQNIVSAIIGDTPKDSSARNDNEGLDLLDFLIAIICDTDLTFCEGNFAYLAQRQRLCCILRNLRKLLCQLKCFDFENIKCDLLSKLLCLLLQIIEEIISIILDLIAIEALCASPGFECRDETFECVFCNLVKNINNLEMLVNELACLVLEIASQQIIICTSCTTAACPTKHKKSCDCDSHKCSCDKNSCDCDSHKCPSNKKYSWRNSLDQD